MKNSDRTKILNVTNKILAITGATGKSGGSFFNLIADNFSEISKTFDGGIRVLTRVESEIEPLQKKLPDIQIYKGSFDNNDFLDTALAGVDTLVHIAGIKLSTKLVDSAIRRQVRRLILVHTTGIYSKYKAAGENYRNIEKYIYEVCKRNDVILTILRPTMIYGNLSDRNVMEFIKMVDKYKYMPVVNGARYELQPVHYSDLSRAYYDVLLNEETTANKDFILSGGKPILLRDMLSVIGQNLGKKVKFVSCPFWLAYFGSWVIYLCTLTKKDYREKVQRLCEPRVFEHIEAKEAFGYNPRTFEDGIVDEVKEYLAKKKQTNRH